MKERQRLWTVMELVNVTAEFFAEKGLASPRLEAELLLAHVLGIERLQIYLQHDRPLVPDEVDRFRALVKRRAQREPLQLLLGTATILDHDFLVRPGVFIPRPETEVLIERCRALEFDGGFPRRIVEVGVGTGCIGISLLDGWPEATLIGFDLNPEAVALSRENAARIGVADRAEFVERDALKGESLPECELLVSNPPYVVASVIPSLEPEVRDHDPQLALDGGADGLDAIRSLAERGMQSLVAGGWLALEHGDDQGESVPACLRDAGYVDVAVFDDLAGRPRVTVGRRG